MTKRGPVKKLINSPENVVADALRGMAETHPELAVEVGTGIVTRAAGPAPGKVAVLSGGGSGHEPLHAGFVGRGMLAGAVAGPVFTSPVPDAIARASAAVDSGAGVLHVVKNYTGDVLNFTMAAEDCADEGVQVEQVVVDDDVAVTPVAGGPGRRGTGATLFVEKIAGALAEEGASLAEVAAVARKVNANARSYGVALSSCTTPAKGSPNFALGEDEIELGIGIHGEPGRERRTLMTAAETAAVMLDAILDDLPEVAGAPVILLVNGLGSTPPVELYVMRAEAGRVLAGRGITVARSLVGSYVTSLDMAGCTFTLCRADEELLRLWDAPVHTPALRWGC
ncbi:PEP-dependent dihydroxyacetone kinase, dihydroxyacetone-binding subunit DhaK [Streptomyces xanthophaeus]|uniref:dihydroxyacetone kinase subunit DhaK n=1 Tax=Streptomyces xanthophaeus TaxID=67385 RepID=UPI00233F04BA|nr:dihydroxyacetone kinase subunit DhaK [Streptomyces xanthophaeus]WCD84805.1 PEP-dependent dihydroxyacetone kinase, dihydroxyacetone-binding subunit DhaK [Streptomyces xanthophaeus]